VRYVQAYREVVDWMYADKAAVKAFADWARVPMILIGNVPSRRVNNFYTQRRQSGERRYAGRRINQQQSRHHRAGQVFDLERSQPAVDRHQACSRMPSREHIDEELEFIAVQNKNSVAVAKPFALQALHASADPRNDLAAAPGSPAKRFYEAARRQVKKHPLSRSQTSFAYS
jgi:hypothetical protein